MIACDLLLHIQDPVERWSSIQQEFWSAFHALERKGAAQATAEEIAALEMAAAKVVGVDMATAAVVNEKQIMFVALARLNLLGNAEWVSELADEILGYSTGSWPNWSLLKSCGVVRSPDRDVGWWTVSAFWKAASQEPHPSPELTRLRQSVLTEAPRSAEALAAKVRVGAVVGFFRLAHTLAGQHARSSRASLKDQIFMLAGAACKRPRSEVLQSVTEWGSFSDARADVCRGEEEGPGIFRVGLVAAGPEWIWAVWEDGLRLGLIHRQRHQREGGSWVA